MLQFVTVLMFLNWEILKIVFLVSPKNSFEMVEDFKSLS